MIGSRMGLMVAKTLTILLTAFIVYPILWTILCSFKDSSDFLMKPVYSLPSKVYTDNYVRALVVGKMHVFFKNSSIATFPTLAIIVMAGSMAAYPIALIRWRLSGLVLSFFLTGIMIPYQIVLTSLFIIHKKLGTLNTLTCLIITYSAFGLPLAIFLFATYMKYIPREIMESAAIDGCSIYNAYARIVLPLSKNAVLTVLSLEFFIWWNDLIFAMTFINRVELKTIQTGLLGFVGEWGEVQWGPVFAGITMVIIPTMILYFALNKRVIQGMIAGALKM